MSWECKQMVPMNDWLLCPCEVLKICQCISSRFCLRSNSLPNEYLNGCRNKRCVLAWEGQIGMAVCEYSMLHIVQWKWVTVIPLTSLQSVTDSVLDKALWLLFHILTRRELRLRSIMQSAPSAILIIAQINEGRELVSLQRRCDVTN